MVDGAQLIDIILNNGFAVGIAIFLVRFVALEVNKKLDKIVELQREIVSLQKEIAETQREIKELLKRLEVKLEILEVRKSE